MSRVVAVHTPEWRRGEQRVHLLRNQRSRWARTLCGAEPYHGGYRPKLQLRWRRCRVENARGVWCETCLRLAGGRAARVPGRPDASIGAGPSRA